VFTIFTIKILLKAVYFEEKNHHKVESTPDNRDFCVTGGAEIHKYNRRPGNKKSSEIAPRLNSWELCRNDAPRPEG
jgi:hypothetical protein